MEKYPAGPGPRAEKELTARTATPMNEVGTKVLAVSRMATGRISVPNNRRIITPLLNRRGEAR